MAKVEEVTRHVSLDEEGRVNSRRWHRFQDCAMMHHGEADGTISEREAGLLGLTECAVCARRASGGPALDILADVLQDMVADLEKNGFDDWHGETAARTVLDYLKARNVYLAIRKPKDNGQVAG